jgi:hypothetical protein
MKTRTQKKRSLVLWKNIIILKKERKIRKKKINELFIYLLKFDLTHHFFVSQYRF